MPIGNTLEAQMGYRLVGIGEFLWDFFPAGKELGGAPANFAYDVSALGGEGLVVSSVGSDPLGDEILERLGTLSLNFDYVTSDTEHPTGTTSVSVGAEGNPSFTIREDVAWDFIPATPQLVELGKNADAITFGTLAQRSEVSRATIRAFVGQTRSNVLRILDINLRQAFYSMEVIEWSLDACDVLKVNEEELQTLAHLLGIEGDESQVLHSLSERLNLRLIALTKGAHGSVLYSYQQISVHGGYKTEVVDTVGCGDAFTAALALGILEGIDLETINDYANRVASFVSSKRGATPPLPEDLKIRQWITGV
ncbi:carbohydrate kinase [Chloroflexota bacterium]